MQLLRSTCVVALLCVQQCNALLDTSESLNLHPRSLTTNPSPIDLSACAGFTVVAGTTTSCGAGAPDQCNIFGGELAAGTTRSGAFNVFDNTPSSNDRLGCVTAAATIVGAARTGLIISGADIAGKKFFPGTHTHPAAASIISNSAITLEGKGDPNSVFIFRIGSTFTMGDASKIVLTNGASQKNVFWIIGTTLAMGANSILVGNVMVGAAAAIADGGMICGDVLVAQSTVVCAGECDIGVVDWQCDTGSTPVANYIPSIDQTWVNIASFCEEYTAVARTATFCGAQASEHCDIFSGDMAAGTTMTGAFHIHQAVIDSFDSAAAKTAHMLVCANAAAMIVAQLRPNGLTMPTEIGGMTFSPGTHIHPAAVSVSSQGAANTTVYLDGKGYSDSVFVFRMGSTLTMGAGCKIVLLNGAQPDHVFWIFGTTLIMGANSTLVGTVMAGSAATIGDGGMLCGDLLIAQSTLTCTGDCSIGVDDSVCSAVAPPPIVAFKTRTESANDCAAQRGNIDYFDVFVSIRPQNEATSVCSTADQNVIGNELNQLLLNKGIGYAGKNDDFMYLAGVCPRPTAASSRRELLSIGYVWRGGGGCRFCYGDNGDNRMLEVNLSEVEAQLLASEWFSTEFKPSMEAELAASIRADILPSHTECLGTNPLIDIEVFGVTLQDFSFSCDLGEEDPELKSIGHADSTMGSSRSAHCNSCVQIDFSNFVDGYYVDASHYHTEHGLNITMKARDCSYVDDEPRIFDSGLPATNGGNHALGSPNEGCDIAGPGQGEKGEPGMLGANCIAVGKVLIIQDSTTTYSDPSQEGGTIYFKFEAPVLLSDIGLMNMYNETLQTMIFTYADSTVESFSFRGFGSNSVQRVVADKYNVKQLDVILEGPGAVTELNFCPSCTAMRI